MTRLGLVLAIAAMLAGCATPPRDAERAAPASYTYVVMGEEGRAVARVITTAAACPAIELDGIGEPMDVRARPATIPLRPTRSEPEESKPSTFPVLVCEKALSTGVTRAVVSGRALALPKTNPRRIVVLGDTGCRIKTSDRAFQACNDATQWPFAAVAAAAAEAVPDLVIHVGDYHYREMGTPTNAELVARVALIARDMGREVASPAETRAALGLSR